MPRAADGTYTLAPVNPVVVGQPIRATWANPSLTDIADALTYSLDRQGKGPMLAPLTLLNSTPANTLHAASKGYVDTVLTGYLPVNGTAVAASKLAPGRTINGVLFDGTTNIAVAPGEAPSDGKQYARKSAAWAEIVIPPSGIPEAPVDGSQYARQNAAWAMVSIPTGLGTLAYNSFTVDDTAPAVPKVGDRWVRPATGDEMVRVPTGDGAGAWIDPGASQIPLPLAIASGGTAGTTAALARTNLGIDTELAKYLPLTGGTLSGPVAFNGVAGATSRYVVFQTAAKSRWTVSVSSGAESGSNAGCDFAIGRWNDAGTWINDVVSIRRSTGDLTFGGGITTSMASNAFFQANCSAAPADNRNAWMINYVNGDVRIGRFNDAGTHTSGIVIQSGAPAVGTVGSVQAGVSGGGYWGKAGINGAYNNVTNQSWQSNSYHVWVDASDMGQVSFVCDERVKQNIVPLAFDAEKFLQIKPIEFEFKTVGIFVADGTRRWGFSAQNLVEPYPLMVVGDVNAVQENGDPQPATPDTVAILAQTVLGLQDALRRIKALEPV